MPNLYSPCVLCPRTCGVDRLAGETGYCGETAVLRIGTAVIYRGEEPPLIGTGGSGTIFISGCNLGCVYCQCYQISQGEKGASALGRAVSAVEFAGICVKLQDNGAENINIVTGSHAVPAVIEGLIAAKKAGVQIPVLWNSSGYECVEALELLKRHVDIFMPDMKTLDSEISAKFCNAPDYPAVASAAVKKMIEIVKEKSPENALAAKLPALAAKLPAREKVIIRHLILPGYLESTRSVLRWYSENVKDFAALSLMTQYTPVLAREKSLAERAPKRYVNKEDFEMVMGWLEELGIDDGFYQEPLTGEEWLPEFTQENPFPSEIAAPVWSGTKNLTSQF